ncbi:hypothetical protein BJP24_10430 [Aeromonas allosaccharophila]|uniref:hypothetical protein n=1 Tax=Aeromonas allosaccharophila TaxID=656 RepID=UPI0005B1FDD5|nr:hypothetical protein [Aeromonas allosaccharophila]OKP44542.1 hypothetical protein BJP24_10430 [Aeromonas allosaccharophila]
MIRTLLLSGAAIAAYALQQSHALLPLLSLLALLSLWVASEIGQFYRDLPDANTDAQEYHHDF